MWPPILALPMYLPFGNAMVPVAAAVAALMAERAFPKAEVEFVARYRMDGRAVRVHERSRFVRSGGRWFYLNGDAL